MTQMQATTRFLPHDLLLLSDPARLIGDTPMPDWAVESLALAPWVVVRRTAFRDGRIPVGIRGKARDQRWAAWLDPRDLQERLMPEALPARLSRLAAGRVAEVAALAGIEPLAALLVPLGWTWGPTGSVGFELASCTPTAKQSSDLDAMIRADDPIDRGHAAALLTEIARLGLRCDLLLETPAGAVALSEYVRDAGPVVARSLDGPHLVADPWQASTRPERVEVGR
ncbi:MAG: malonate decarboxylase holo-ACP synthase [Dongiaceae bacterium]